MKVITTQPIEGVEAEQEVDVAADRGEWLIVNGYAKPAKGSNPTDHGLLATSSSAAKDPTLAQNREAPDAQRAPDGTANDKATQVNTGAAGDPKVAGE